MSRPRPSANDGVSVNHGITLSCLPPAALIPSPGLAGVTDGLSTINLDHSAVTSLHLDLSGFEMVRAALWTEFEETGDSSVLDQVIECDEEILEMCPIGHQGRADACMRLSASLYSQMEFVPVVSPFALADDGVSREDQLETTRMIRDTLWVEYEQTRDADTLEQVIQLDERTMALCPVGHRDRALACAYLASSLQSKLFHTARFSATDRNHDPAIDPSTLELSSAALRSWLDRYRDTDDPKQLDQLISVRRRVLKYFPYDHHFRPMTCYLLAQSLNKKYQQSGDMDVLEEVVRLQREARTLCPPEDKMRAAMCHALGMSSHNLFLHTHDTALIDDAIEFLRESLVLYPHGHADRVVSCGNLAVVLTARYNHGPDLIFLDEAIILERQVLELIPPDHPQYAASCNNLASSLSLRYSQTRDDDLLREVIELQRKVLDVYPSVDQGRAIACGNLAHTLRIYSDQTGDIEVLDESLRLNREALSLFSRNSPHRASACLSLMRYLQERYEKTNDVGLLSELTQLQREALALCSPRHPRRADACLNLADTLSKRYRQTGDIDLIDECIGLQREALRLQFAGNLDHSFACKALAGSLATLYAHGNNNTALDEAIVLARQSLTECPPNSDEHAALSLNLVAYIIYRYKQLRHVDDLQEAIHICRSVLESTACTDTVRVGVCINLATCLRHLHESTGNTEPLDEAIEVMEQASAFSDSSKSWRISISLCELYLLWGSGHPTHRASISMSRALESLNAASQAQNDDIGAFMDGMFSTLLSTIWSIHESWRHSNVCLHLVPVYARVIDNLPLMAAFALNTGSRLRGLRSYTQIGSQACVVALEAECSPRAIEMLDQAHGVIWTQALHQRDPELTGVPHELATELHGLLRAIDLPINMVMDHDHLAPQDVRHAHNSRIQTLLGEIRAIPGLERFMRGYEFEQLRQVAIDHPVVVLVAMDSENYAVIISRASQDVPDVIKLDVTSETMLQLRSNMHRSGARWRTTTEEGYSEVVEDADASERLMRPGGYDYSLTGVLSRLWKLIVKPVLSHLGFEASLLSHMTRIRTHPFDRSKRETDGLDFIGVLLDTSHLFRSTRQACTPRTVKNALRTM
jgi:hypothetical protein